MSSFSKRSLFVTETQIPSGLPPTGNTGGDLSGTYPNPSVIWANGYSTYDLRYQLLSTPEVTSFNTRTGAVTLTSLDVTTALGYTPYNASNPSGYITSSFITDTLITGKLLTGYVSGAGTISSSDSILSAIQKLNGNIGALVTGISSVSGTANRITSTGGSTPVIDISASYIGQSSITTLGTITTGTWNASLLTGTYGGSGVNNGSTTFTRGGNVTFSGAFNFTGTLSNTTTVTFPTTGTLATLAGSEALTNKTYNGNTWTAGTNTLTLAGNLITTGAFNTTLAAQFTGITTLPPVATTLVGKTGTMVANYISYWNDANQLTGKSAFTFDGINTFNFTGTTPTQYIFPNANTGTSALVVADEAGSAFTGFIDFIYGGTNYGSSNQIMGLTRTSKGFLISGGANNLGLCIGTIVAQPLYIGTNNIVRATVSSAGSFVVGNAALATNAIDGFLYIPTCAGTPTGVPTSFTGRVPMIYDSVNNIFYIYNGTWKGGIVPGTFV